MMYSFSVEDHCRRRSPHVPSFHPPSPTLSSTSEDDDAISPPRPRAIASFKDANEIIASAQKMLHEWNKQWGTVASFSFRVVDAFLDFGLIKMPADRARGELMAMVQKGREALLRLGSIAFTDTQSIRGDNLQQFCRVVEGLHERVAHAEAVLRWCPDIQTCT
jgi:hypothetical protein